MSNKNDQLIIQLKEKVERLRKELGPDERFNPVTNCAFTMFGVMHNLNALSEEGLKFLASSLHSMQKSSTELGYGELMIGGYPVESWLKDISSRLAILVRRGKVSRLADMEKKLATLLSEDKRTALALDEIAEDLGEFS